MNSNRRRRIRAALARRDGAACFYCTTPFADLAHATIDHLIPQSVLPGWPQYNLVLACWDCNQAKADTLPQVFMRRLEAGQQRERIEARRQASRRRTGLRAPAVRTRARLALAA
jgi:5-methylcytosine-specific restriction endonuclease McrA